MLECFIAESPSVRPSSEFCIQRIMYSCGFHFCLFPYFAQTVGWSVLAESDNFVKTQSLIRHHHVFATNHVVVKIICFGIFSLRIAKIVYYINTAIVIASLHCLKKRKLHKTKSLSKKAFFSLFFTFKAIFLVNVVYVQIHHKTGLIGT